MVFGSDAFVAVLRVHIFLVKHSLIFTFFTKVHLKEMDNHSNELQQLIQMLFTFLKLKLALRHLWQFISVLSSPS